MAGCTEKTAVLLLLTMMFTICLDSLAGRVQLGGPHVPTVCAPAAPPTFLSPPRACLDAAFPTVTVMMTVCGALVATPPLPAPPSSWTCTVTVADAFLFAAGV